MKLLPALILDLDGTVRRTKSGKPFIEKFDDMELMPDIERIMGEYRNKGYLLFGVSNQGGVAHGFKKVEDVDVELEYMDGLFEENPFHMIKVCFHDQSGHIEPFNHRSLCRKPDIGMLALLEMEAWKQNYIVDWNNSLFVGDRLEDEQCAKNALVPFMYIDKFLKEHAKAEGDSN